MSTYLLHAALALVLSTSAGEEQATHTFREPPMGSSGLTRIEDLRGRPTLIEFWGTR